MEALFKKQFWVVNLLFLAANAFLLARASNQFLAYFVTKQLTQTSSGDVARPAALAPRGKHKTLRDLDEKNNIFGAQTEQVVEGPAVAVKEEPKATPLSDADPVPTTLRIKLSGVTWYENAEWSLATITDLATQDTSLYSVNPCPAAVEGVDVRRRHPCNQLLADATITEIEPQRVVFINKTANRKEFIDLNDEANKPLPGPTNPPPVVVNEGAPPPAEGADNLGKGIVKVAEGQYKIPQADVDEVLANLNSVATQARIVPSFEGGKANGFKLFSIRPNSVYSKIGIQNGDVINRINGYEISSPDKALEVYNKLKDSKEITVDVTRRGQKQTMSYSIQ
ncbi:MAG: type II secretion system protein GspC [Myxococcota bacterium]